MSKYACLVLLTALQTGEQGLRQGHCSNGEQALDLGFRVYCSMWASNFCTPSSIADCWAVTGTAMYFEGLCISKVESRHMLDLQQEPRY